MRERASGGASVHGFATKTTALAREIPPATQAKLNSDLDNAQLDGIDYKKLKRKTRREQLIGELKVPEMV